LGVGALIFNGNEILVVERAGEPLKGYWSLPGGLVETGELIEDAVKREVREDTGLEVEPLYRFDIFERIMRDADGRPEYHFVLVDYVCKIAGGDLRPADDVSRVEWVAREKLREYNITAGTLEAMERAYDDVRRRER
jgi:ADP-ribose pyrophosphatase YjhB (NUDIX family)